MRALLVAAILATAIFAGCFGKGGDDDKHETYQCPSGGPLLKAEDFPDHDNATFDLPSKCPKKSGTNSTTSASRAPNVLPTLVFKAKDDGGNETNSTLKGGNLTFDATGSFDPDGNITGLAMTVTDANQTRTVTLYDSTTKAFTPRTFSFDRAGRANLTVAVVDDRGGFTTLNTQVFVDELQVVGKDQFQGRLTYVDGETPPCVGPLTDAGVEGGAAADALYFFAAPFQVPDDAAWFEATLASGSANFGFCSPPAEGADGGEPISDRATSGTVTTSEGVALPAAKGVASYSVGIYHQGNPMGSVKLNVIVHYGPRPAA